MHRIDAANNVKGQFIEKDKISGRPGTFFSSAWLNDLQETICKTIEDEGVELTKGDPGQLSEAINRRVAKAFVDPAVQTLQLAQDGEPLAIFPAFDMPHDGGVTFEYLFQKRINSLLTITFRAFGNTSITRFWCILLPKDSPLPLTKPLAEGLLFTTEAATVTADIFAIGSAQIIGRSAGDSIPIQPGSCSFARLMNGNFGFRLCLFITTAAPIDAGHILADWSFSGSFERKAAGDD